MATGKSHRLTTVNSLGYMEGQPVNRRTVETIEYKVTGTGRFPFDMLRRDSAWPADETQSYLLYGEDGDAPSKRTVRLRGLHYPTVGRWRSFGWSVGDTGIVGDNG